MPLDKPSAYNTVQTRFQIVWEAVQECTAMGDPGEIGAILVSAQATGSTITAIDMFIINIKKVADQPIKSILPFLETTRKSIGLFVNTVSIELNNASKQIRSSLDKS